MCASEMFEYLSVQGLSVAFLVALLASLLLGIFLWPGTQHIVILWPVACNSLARLCARSARACPGPG
jgi:hypothetical protein